MVTQRPYSDTKPLPYNQRMNEKYLSIEELVELERPAREVRARKLRILKDVLRSSAAHDKLRR